MGRQQTMNKRIEKKTERVHIYFYTLQVEGKRNDLYSAPKTAGPAKLRI